VGKAGAAMKRDRRTLLILFGVFVALALLVTLQARPPETSPYSTERVFRGFSVDDIQAVRLHSEPESLTFTISRAADGAWTAPDASGRLNTDVAEVIARTMILLPYVTLLEAGDDLSVYGFVPLAGLGVEFVLSDGTAHAVVVGFRNPTETGYYALVDERPEIYILERAAVDFLISVLRSPPIA
jgi:hypothetical protein